MNSDCVRVQLTGLDLLRRRDPTFVARVRTGGSRSSIYEAASPQSTLEFAVAFPAGSYRLEVDALDAGRSLLLGSISTKAVSSAFRMSGWIENGLVGFAAFYSPRPFTVQVKTRSRSLGALGADCLLLDVKDSRKVSVRASHSS